MKKKEMQIRAFLLAIEVICRRHNLSISHQDHYGAFIIERFSEENMKWLRAADFDERDDKR